MKIEAQGSLLAVRTMSEEGETLKQIHGAEWSKKAKCWYVPASNVLELVKVSPRADVCPRTKAYAQGLTTRLSIIDGLKSGQMEPSEHAFLMRHQRVCRDIAKQFSRYAFFLDTGTGKTLTALQIIQDNLPMKWVVLCPKAIIKTAWLADAAQFYPSLKVLPLSKNMTKQELLGLAASWGIDVNNKVFNRAPAPDILRQLTDIANVLIVNPESFKAATVLLNRAGVQGLIFDESVKLKNPGAQITKQVTEAALDMKKLYLLSGKPAPNNHQEYFSQMRLVDPGMFGMNFYRFRERYFLPDYLGFNWTIKREKEAEFGRRLARRCIFVAKEDCLDLPEKTYLIHEVELGDKARKYYREMEKERCILFTGSRATAALKVTQLMKLRQITSGFLIDDDRATTPLHRHKLDALMDVLEGIGDKQVIIWCDFQQEVREIEVALGDKCVTAYGGTKNVDSSISLFKSGAAQYIIAHPKTLKYGVTLVGPSMAKGDCTYAVYYTLSYSYDDYYQSHDRIYRKGLTKPVTFIFLMVPNSIDGIVYQALQNKGDMAKAVENYVKGVR